MEMDIVALYEAFDVPISLKDCGKLCSPYNEYGVPFCCDIHLMVPSAYHKEWEYLRAHTELWQTWESVISEDEQEDYTALAAVTPKNQVLIACKGHHYCQRQFRSIICRAFPFYPYVDSHGILLGLAYYWEYRFSCWVISHLECVTEIYRNQFINAFKSIFALFPEESETFAEHSTQQRKQFIAMHKRIMLLHRDGSFYTISPRNECLHPISAHQYPKFGVYALSDILPFPDEMNDTPFA